MTNEEFEKKMEFIIEHQAQFSADIERLKELHAQAEIRMARTENIIVRLYQDTSAKFNALADSQMRLVEAQAQTDVRFNALIETQAQTDERLNTLINVVERYISEGRNGGSQGRGES